MKHMRQVLREVNSFRRVVGFQDAVSDLGTHRICGTDIPYSRQMVYNVLYGRSASKKLIERIVEKRPDLLDLSFVVEATRKIAREMGWRPGMLPARKGQAARLGEGQAARLDEERSRVATQGEEAEA